VINLTDQVPFKPRDENRQCSRCNRVLPIEAFWYMTKYGRYRAQCRECLHAKRRKWDRRIDDWQRIDDGIPPYFDPDDPVNFGKEAPPLY
jgi:late competence protein required for DNA uptake (superfamily II DNA/RNA helicase)